MPSWLVLVHGRSFIVSLIYLCQTLNARKDENIRSTLNNLLKLLLVIHVIYTCVSQLVERVPLLELDGQLGAILSLEYKNIH
jgi:hypothetical protein